MSFDFAGITNATNMAKLVEILTKTPTRNVRPFISKATRSSPVAAHLAALLPASRFSKASVWRVLNEIHPYVKYLNAGLSCFGMHFAAQVIIAHMIVFNCTLVSFGSGGGFLETLIRDGMAGHFDKRVWVHAVDNQSDASIWTAQGIISAENLPKGLPFPVSARTIETFAIKFKQLTGNCALLLNWCYPNDDVADFNAITHMRPKIVIAIYECVEQASGLDAGSAGGFKFHKWVQTTKTYRLIYSDHRAQPIKNALESMFPIVLCFDIWAVA